MRPRYVRAVTRTGTEWIDAFATRLGVDPPDAATVEVLLELAGVAAHGSERIAAPLACWLVGRAGLGGQHPSDRDDLVVVR
jgi:hypothetical protein